MKKLLSFLVLIVMVSIQSQAQAIRWGTKSTSPGIKTEEGFAIAADSMGNNYITGSYTDTIWFGSTMLLGRGQKDVFVVKLDSNGQYLWARTFGGSGNDEGFGISVDIAGNVYVTGYFNNTLFFSPSDSLVSSGLSDMFIVRFDSGGNLQIRIREGSTTADYGRAIWAHPTNGEFAVSGDKNSLTVYVGNYIATGAREWYREYSTTVSLKTTGVCMDNAGEVFVSGYFRGNMNPPNLVSLNSIDAFSLVFTNTGTLDDYFSFGSTTTSEYAYSIYCNGAGTRYYLCGSIGSTTNFGDDAWGTNYTLTGSGGFIAAFDRPGNWWWTAWAKKSTGSAEAYYDIDQDKFGNVIVANNYMATVSYNNWGGSPAWSATPTIGNITGCANNSVATDKFGNVYTTGKFKQTFGFGDSTLVTNSYATVFTQKISTAIIKSPGAGTEKCISQVQGDSLIVQVQPSMNYHPGNVFTLQIDTTGTSNFSNPVTLGTLNSTGSGTIHAYIPVSLADVTYGYIRVISSDPATTMGDLTYIYIEPRPIAELSEDSIFRCANGAGVEVSVYQVNPLSGGWGCSYQWSPTSGLSAPAGSTTTVYPFSSTNYTITITDTYNGCAGTAILHAISWPRPTIDAGNDTIICAGTSLMLHATGTDIQNYSWTPTATLQNPTTATPIATPTQITTNYLCQVTSDHGCTNNDNIYVTTYTVTANAGPASYNTCLGGSVQLTGTMAGGQLYLWSPQNNISNPNISNPVVTPAVTTTYTLTAMDTVHNCSKTDTIRIIVGPIVVNANDIAITCGNSGNLVATATGNYVSPLSYSWTPAAGLSSTTGSTVAANPIESQTYFVTLTTGNGCSGADSARVTVNEPNFGVSFSATQQLFTSPPFIVQFSNATPSPSNYTFTWLWGDGTSTQSSNATVFHQYQYNGNYDVTLVAVSNTTGCTSHLFQGGYIFCTGGTGCTLTATVSTPQGTTACMGDSILLTCNTGVNYSFQWNLNGSPISGADSQVYLATVPGYYSVSIDDQTCNIVSQQVLLGFSAPPAVPVITPNGNINLCGGGSVFLTAPSGYTSYEWNTGASSQNITVTQSGVYSVSVTSGTSSCESSASYSLNASPMPAPEICIVGVDSLSGKNMVIWEPAVTNEIDSFYVYREGIMAGVFEKIGATHYSAFSTFIDTNSNPAQQAYRYRLSVLDTCGVETLESDFHKTMHLTINQGIGNSWNLIWNHYEGFAVSTYNIYRGTTPGDLTYLTSIASTFSSFTDLTPPVGWVYYQIEADNPSGCNPAKDNNQNYSSPRSNMVDNDGAILVGMGILSFGNSFLLFPNPAGDYFQIGFSDVSNRFDCRVEILDATGRVVSMQNFPMSPQENLLRYDLGGISDGVYMIRIQNGTSLFVKQLVIRK